MSFGDSAAEVAPLTTMASAMFFGSILFAAVSLATKTAWQGNWSMLQQAAQNPKSSPLDVKSMTSVFTLLYHSSVMGFILFYAYICEYHPPFPHSGKSYDRDQFFFLTALLIVASFFTWRRHDKPKAAAAPPPPPAATPTDVSTKPQQRHIHFPEKASSSISTGSATSITSYPSSGECKAVAPVDDRTEVLNRDQTEEWKGWMQFMFLLYHYYHAEEVYNAIRIMITCYVWMTGFGNFSFFYIKGDYSSIRVIQMLWRLNFLVIFLCLTQGTTYILYYICLLHTYFFLMVYVTMRIAKHLNYTKWGIRFKIAAVACCIYVLWDMDNGIFRLLHYPFLSEKPMLGATAGSMWEWYFRSSLDHWSTLLGMVFALNFPITSLFFRKLEALSFWRHVAAKSIMAVVVFIAVYYWTTGPFMQPKIEYNATNAYYGCIPLLAYIFFRNLTPWLRSHSLDLLHQIGKSTLETYLMQHHIWLTSNAKSLLTLIPGWPKMNFLVVSILYFVVSRRLYNLTLFLRGMILPNDRNACLINLAAMTAILLFFIGLAAFMRFMGVLDLLGVALVSVGCGMTVLQIISERTNGIPSHLPSTSSNGTNSNGTSSNPDNARSNKPSVNGVTSVPSFQAMACGAIAVAAVGIAWNHMARSGASRIQDLPATCQPYVQEGAWIPVDGCNEDSRGLVYRDYYISSLGTCHPQTKIMAWGWKRTPSNTHCRFAQRDANSLRKTLRRRNVTFVGDSMMRHLYHATCRQLGDSRAGAFNTSMAKWTDYSQTYGSAALEFRWAPYTQNITNVLYQMVTMDATATHRPDLVVVGGGAWDRLHLYSTADEQETLAQHLQSITQTIQELRRKGVPVTWVTPTTINTWGLPSEEKRDNIREEQIADLRQLYKSKGIYDAATFTLDGTKFTAERVSESYDGVHYPLSVYDAGAQILANSFDWLLPERNDTTDLFTPPHPGKMAHPILGFIMLLFVFLGIFSMDGFMGISYLVCFFAPHCVPERLYYEAFSTLHRRVGLPTVEKIEDDKRKGSDHPGDPESDDERETFISQVADKA